MFAERMVSIVSSTAQAIEGWSSPHFTSLATAYSSSGDGRTTRPSCHEQGVDPRAFLRFQDEAEDGQVLVHVGGAARARERHHALLREVAEQHLGRRAAMVFGKRLQAAVGEELG